MNNFLLKKYCAIVVCLIGSFAIISFAAIVSHNFTLAGQRADLATPGELSPAYNGDGNYSADIPAPPPPANPDINVLILGLDEGSLPDTIFVALFDGATNMIDIVGVPRDTQIFMTDEERAMFAEIGRNFPQHGNIKLNELHSWAGLANGYRLLTHRLENMLQIEIDYHVIIDLDDFKYIVDAVGGIYMDIPPPGLFYNAEGGTIAVNIQPGHQHLDGRRAEQVVRFRQFRDGDIGRINMQQAFMQEFFVQVLSNDNIMNNFLPLAQSVFGRVRTDIGLVSLFRYAGLVEYLDTQGIEFHMLEGHSGMAPDLAGINRSWFFVDVEASRRLIEQIYEDNAALAQERRAN